MSVPEQLLDAQELLRLLAMIFVGWCLRSLVQLFLSASSCSSSGYGSSRKVELTESPNFDLKRYYILLSIDILFHIVGSLNLITYFLLLCANNIL